MPLHWWKTTHHATHGLLRTMAVGIKIGKHKPLFFQFGKIWCYSFSSSKRLYTLSGPAFQQYKHYIRLVGIEYSQHAIPTTFMKAVQYRLCLLFFVLHERIVVAQGFEMHIVENKIPLSVYRRIVKNGILRKKGLTLRYWHT